MPRKRTTHGPKIAKLKSFLAESERQYARMEAQLQSQIHQVDLERQGAVEQLNRVRDGAQDAERRATEAEVARDVAQAAARSATAALATAQKDVGASIRLARIGDRLAALVETAERRQVKWDYVGVYPGGSITGRFGENYFEKPGYFWSDGQWQPVTGKPSYETLEHRLRVEQGDRIKAERFARELESKYNKGFETYAQAEERAGTARRRLLESAKNVARSLAIVCGTDELKMAVGREGATNIGGLREEQLPTFIADCMKRIEAEARSMAQRIPPAVSPCPSPDCSATVTITGRQMGKTHRAVVGILTDYTDERLTLHQAETLLVSVLAGTASRPKVEEAIAKLRRLATDNRTWMEPATRTAYATDLASKIMEALS